MGKQNLGFGKETPEEQKVKQSKLKRQEASQKYDEMKSSGSPIFNIFVRIKGDSRWLVAGSLAVERSAQIDAAIFQQEEELRKGAIRLYPKLGQNLNNLEYGHQLKEFPDEEIKLAVRTEPNLGNKVSSFFKQLREQISPKSTQPKYSENQNKKSQGRTSR